MAQSTERSRSARGTRRIATYALRWPIWLHSSRDGAGHRRSAAARRACLRPSRSRGSWRLWRNMLTCDFCETTLIQHDCALRPLCGGCLVPSADHTWQRITVQPASVDTVDRQCDQPHNDADTAHAGAHALAVAEDERQRLERAKMARADRSYERAHNPPITGEAWDKIKREGPAWCPKPYGSRGL